MKIGLLTVAYNEGRMMPKFLSHLPKWINTTVVLVSNTPWFGKAELPDNTDITAEKMGADVIVHDWDSEEEQRNAGLDYLNDCDWVIVLDPDEFLDNSNWKKLRGLIDQNPENNAFVVDHQKVYWKDGWHAVPDRDYQQLILVRPNRVRFVDKRVIDSSFAIAPVFIHHFSWAKTDAECWSKISHYAHAKDFDIEKWFNEVWLKWTPEMQDVHPTTPETLHRFQKAKLPTELERLDLWAR